MTKLTGAALDRAVAHAMGLKSVNNCEGWGKMKLYDVPRNSVIVLKNGLELKFHHIDGMYSVCTDEEGNVYHIGASEEVEIKPKEAKNDT